MFISFFITKKLIIYQFIKKKNMLATILHSKYTVAQNKPDTVVKSFERIDDLNALNAWKFNQMSLFYVRYDDNWTIKLHFEKMETYTFFTFDDDELLGQSPSNSCYISENSTFYSKLRYLSALFG